MTAQFSSTPQGYAHVLAKMPSIRRQLATFFAVLAVLYAGGFIVGQFIETGEDAHGGGDRQHERGSRGALMRSPLLKPLYTGLGSHALPPARKGSSAPGHT